MNIEKFVNSPLKAKEYLSELGIHASIRIKTIQNICDQFPQLQTRLYTKNGWQWLEVVNYNEPSIEELKSQLTSAGIVFVVGHYRPIL